MPDLSTESFLGYSFCGPVGGSLIPQRLQGLCMRDYAQSKNLLMSFVVSEYYDSALALMLLAQLDNIEKIAGFIFYSVLQLPADSERRKLFCRQVLGAKKTIHFALEDMILKDDDSYEMVERIHQINLDPRFDETRSILLRMDK